MNELHFPHLLLLPVPSRPTQIHPPHHHHTLKCCSLNSVGTVLPKNLVAQKNDFLKKIKKLTKLISLKKRSLSKKLLSPKNTFLKITFTQRNTVSQKITFPKNNDLKNDFLQKNSLSKNAFPSKNNYIKKFQNNFPPKK